MLVGHGRYLENGNLFRNADPLQQKERHPSVAGLFPTPSDAPPLLVPSDRALVSGEPISSFH
jgi:hypothetical protein